MYQKIKYFLKAAETGSFSDAAREMYVTSQALTKQIGVLEKELGGRLFDRTQRGVTLTQLGFFAARKFSEIINDTDAAISDVQEYAKNDKSRVTVGIFSALSRDDLVMPVVSYLLASFPMYQINLEMLELEDARKKMHSGKLDILITLANEQEEQNGYQYYSFEEHETKVVVSLTHPWVLKKEITEQDMRKEIFLQMPIDADWYHLSEPFVPNPEIPCKSAQTVSNFNTLLMILHQGQGFSLLPMAFSGMGTSQIKSFSCPRHTFIYHTVLLHRRDEKSEGVRQVISGLRDEFELNIL